jgi:hypothetical protein
MDSTWQMLGMDVRMAEVGGTSHLKDAWVSYAIERSGAPRLKHENSCSVLLKANWAARVLQTRVTTSYGKMRLARDGRVRIFITPYLQS